MSLSRQDIINEIKRTAKSNGGIPLGKGRFEKETGIKPYDWGKFWAKFGDAQQEAGFEANALNAAYDETYIIKFYVLLIQELGHFPTMAELAVKSANNPNFPSKTTMQKIGKKKVVAEKIVEYASQEKLFDVVKICESTISDIDEHTPHHDSQDEICVGEVYLFKSGRYFKIGKTNDTVRRGQEIRVQLPERLELIHSIKTDDPSGVEAYWHKRFDSKRMQGEWFDLDSNDIKAFKRWRRIS
jgi:hypothetical protein